MGSIDSRLLLEVHFGKNLILSAIEGKGRKLIQEIKTFRVISAQEIFFVLTLSPFPHP
jgi:hypothetical protein